MLFTIFVYFNRTLRTLSSKKQGCVTLRDHKIVKGALKVSFLVNSALFSQLTKSCLSSRSRSKPSLASKKRSMQRQLSSIHTFSQVD